jgi:hypothetical protein
VNWKRSALVDIGYTDLSSSEANGTDEGQLVRIYNVARTVADCFRFRNSVGLDVALEALSEAWRSRRLNLDELTRVARQLRVQRVMQPYLEAVVL